MWLNLPKSKKTPKFHNESQLKCIYTVQKRIKNRIGLALLGLPYQFNNKRNKPRILYRSLSILVKSTCNSEQTEICCFVLQGGPKVLGAKQYLS